MKIMEEKEGKKKSNKVAIGPVHLVVAVVSFGLIIYLIYKVALKYIVKPSRTATHNVSSLPFHRVTLLNPTPLYATPSIQDELEVKIPKGTKILITKIVKKKWTFYQTRYNGRTRWIAEQFLQHVPVKINEGQNLAIGKEKVDINNCLPFNYKPTDLKRVPRKFLSPYDARKHYLRKEALNAFSKMILAAKKEGIKLYLISTFRSAKYQLKLYLRSIRVNNNPNQKGTAKPTYSEHQLGTTADISSPEVGYRLSEDFEHTRAFRWLKRNMKKFGMRLSYPRGNRDGYIYEPWHLRYVGK